MANLQNSPNPSDERFSAFGLLLLAAVSLFWGINWSVMKIILRDIPPLYFRSTTLILAGIGLLAVARAGGHKIKIPQSAWRPLAGISLFNITAWNCLITYGVSMIPSGRAALLGYTMPLWSSLLSMYFLGERIVWQRIASLVCGLVGISVLMGNDFAAIRAAWLGTLCMIAAAWSWAIGIVLLKRLRIAMPTIVLTAWSMVFGGLPLLVVALPLETSRLIVPGTAAILGVVYTIFLNFMLCYWAWNRIVLMLPVSVSSLSSLGVPLIGVVSGALLLNESLGWREALAAALILSSVASVSIRR
ncbi:MAG: DMT family transporter [Candidatus Accumulibacter sp.]|jgi:drug/metabolite transporter (DMT)-like permease|nr:DMT family transporter [Accumulibacter sp.]